MIEKVLTDGEKDALLEGMSTGQVEVQSNDGPLYAEVKAFEIGPRSRIATNSYPRLQILNRQLAGRLSKQAELLLNVETEISAGSIDFCSYSEFCERIQDLSLAIEYSMSPLSGPGLLYMDSTLVGHLVEAFFGGHGNDSIRLNPEFFSPGEISVISLFANALLSTLQEVWQSLIEITPERIATRLSTDIVDNLESADDVICTEFKMCFSNRQETFHVVWPLATVAPLIPVFEGQKRERNAAEDGRWEKTLRSRATDLVIGIAANVGQAELTLAEVAELAPGDIINIENPRKATIFAQHVAVLEGRFGVHDGRNAFEATRWLEPDCRLIGTTR